MLGRAALAWTGEFGSAEFIASFHAAVTARKAPPPGTLLSLLQGYQASDDFLSRAPRTRTDYVKQIMLIEGQVGDFPLSALRDPRTRGEFMSWRDKLAIRSRRQADYAWTVLARVLSWGKDRGIIPVNPCERGGRLYLGPAPRKSGRTTMKRRSIGLRHLAYICRFSSPCGRGSAKAIYFA